MELIQCPNNHYYDRDRHTSCPYCGSDETLSVYAAFKEPEETMASEAEASDEPYPNIISDAEFDDFPESLTMLEESRTVGYFSRRIGVEPVVGWLVAVDGKYFGEDFRLKAGRNFVGRSPEMDVQLSLDPSVSRRRHAIVVYEPKSRTFLAQPGDSRELFYLNDEVVLNAAPLKEGDILTIGESRLMLVPLCGKGFNWNQEDVHQ